MQRRTLPLLHLAGSGLLGAVSGFDGAADVDEVVVVPAGQVVEAVVFGERRQVEGETCGAEETQVRHRVKKQQVALLI